MTAFSFQLIPILLFVRPKLSKQQILPFPFHFLEQIWITILHFEILRKLTFLYVIYEDGKYESALILHIDQDAHFKTPMSS